MKMNVNAREILTPLGQFFAYFPAFRLRSPLGDTRMLEQPGAVFFSANFYRTLSAKAVFTDRITIASGTGRFRESETFSA
jgi:hypothetical protein